MAHKRVEERSKLRSSLLDGLKERLLFSSSAEGNVIIAHIQHLPYLFNERRDRYSHGPAYVHLISLRLKRSQGYLNRIVGT